MRFVGAAILVMACVLVLRTCSPTLVAPIGDSFAVRGRDGPPPADQARQRRFAICEWLAADADARSDPRAAGPS